MKQKPIKQSLIDTSVAKQRLAHTPTPWVAEWSNRSGSAEQEHKGWHIFNPLTLNDEGLIAELPDGNENRMGDAAFIVRACNEYYDNKARNLVAANLLSEMIDGGEECSGRDTAISHIIGLLQGDDNVCHVERTALAKARGEKKDADYVKRQLGKESRGEV